MNEAWPIFYIIGLFYLGGAYTYYRENQFWKNGSEYQYSNIPLTRNGIGILFFLMALIAFLFPLFY
jgi:hypothetical protein|tara:strand:+ start:52 stop:249 length:198 start_codon:yes stop_codon:yes gene_type:complete